MLCLKHAQSKKVLRDLIKEKGSLRQMARELGLDHGNLFWSLNSDSNPRLNTIEKVLDHLGYEIRIVKLKEKNRMEGGETENFLALDQGRIKRR